MGNILIVGGGFGGLIVAERLAAINDGQHVITLVSPNRSFTFYPALVQLAFGKCVPEDIAFELRPKLDELGVRFVHGEMIDIDTERRTARVSGDDIDGDIAFDHIVFAMGRRLATERVGGFFENAHHLLGIKAAMKTGEAIGNFSSGRIIVAACPDGRLPVPVCETAFALARKFEKEMADKRVIVSVLFPGSLADAFGGARLHKELEAGFTKRGIDVHYDIPISHIDGSQVVSSAGHRIEYDLLIAVPPFRGCSALRPLGITDEDDFINVNGQMQVHGLTGAYAVGDVVAFSGPKLGHMAVRQAEVAAENLTAELEGRTPEAEYYHEIAAVIDAGGSESIFLHYGIWDEATHHVSKGYFWSWAKTIHDAAWRRKHQ